MIRALFFTCGLFTALCGGVLVGVDRLVLTDYARRHVEDVTGPIARAEPPNTQVEPAEAKSPWQLVSLARPVGAETEGPLVVDPPDWAAFALLSAGGITLIYSLALPGRRDEEDDEE